jgi:DNA topoisomerase-3
MLFGFCETEVELISLMDRNGIGTDATIAQHISTIQERKYAIKDANQTFRPTQLGIALIEGYNRWVQVAG